MYVTCLYKLCVGPLGEGRVRLEHRAQLGQVDGVEEGDEDDGVRVAHRDGGHLCTLELIQGGGGEEGGVGSHVSRTVR